MSPNPSNQSLAESAKALGALFDQGTRIGLSLLGSMGTSSAQMVSGILQRVGTPSLSARGCGCEIPPPCWEPQPSGEVVSPACPGATATVRLIVTNCASPPRKIHFHATGDSAGVLFSPTELDLGPLARGTDVVSFPVPAAAKPGEEYEILVWIRGCQEHYIRWTVKVASGGADCCHEVQVEDCPDYVHHWYDHFYCQRACTHGR
jgi:hypothetical protein